MVTKSSTSGFMSLQRTGQATSIKRISDSGAESYLSMKRRT